MLYKIKIKHLQQEVVCPPRSNAIIEKEKECAALKKKCNHTGEIIKYYSKLNRWKLFVKYTILLESGEKMDEKTKDGATTTEHMSGHETRVTTPSSISTKAASAALVSTVAPTKGPATPPAAASASLEDSDDQDDQDQVSKPSL